MRNATPTLIAGRYEVGELLGRGGMAEVYAGVDRRLSRPVAIKLLQDSMAVRDDVRVRFEAEARAAAAILQPHAVAVYDTGEHEGVPYIVMERLPGDTLADRIAAGPVLTGAEARTFGGQVLGALEAAHGVGMVHRDVKPGNILLTGDGSAKIADFGIAKSIDVGADLTGTGQLIGTPAYLSPEQIGGDPASPLSDLYALGIVLYEALAGRKPFAGVNTMTVARAVVHGDHIPLGTVRPDLDPALVRTVERAMEPDPAARFPSAAAMAAALVAPAEPMSMVVPGGGGDPTIAADRTQVLDATDIAGAGSSAAAIATPTAVATAAAVGPAPMPRPPASPLAARRQPSRAGRLGLVALAAVAIVFLLVQVVRALPRDKAPTAADVSAAAPSSTVAPATTAPQAALATSAALLAAGLRDAAGHLSPSDGAAAAELATRLGAIADLLERGDPGATAGATTLIVDVARWRQAGQLTDGATVTAIQLLQKVPGVAVAPPVGAEPKPGKGKGKHGD